MSNKWQVPRSNIVFDADGLGKNIKEYLRGSVPLHSGQSAIHPEYFNIKAELYYKLAEIVNSSKMFIDCYITPELKETLISELSAIKRKSDVGEKLKIEPKSVVKELIGHSPDLSDAFAYRMLFLLTRGY
jgi:hypothetical protein